MKWLLESNSAAARLCRTMIEAALGFLVANIDVLFSGFTIAPEYKLLIMGFIVSVSSPILAALRENKG